MTTGEKIKLARKAAKMTQRELSEKTGIVEPTIRKYESDRLNPKYNTLVKFANALGVRMAYFLSEKTLDEIKKNSVDLDHLICLYYLLNERGRQIALERLKELTQIPDYQRKDGSDN